MLSPYTYPNRLASLVMANDAGTNNNSDTYAGDVFEEITGVAPTNPSGIAFPGLTGDMRQRGQPACIPVKDTTGCR